MFVNQMCSICFHRTDTISENTRARSDYITEYLHKVMLIDTLVFMHCLYLFMKIAQQP